MSVIHNSIALNNYRWLRGRLWSLAKELMVQKEHPVIIVNLLRRVDEADQAINFYKEANRLDNVVGK